jgi:hypothetical protein
LGESAPLGPALPGLVVAGGILVPYFGFQAATGRLAPALAGDDSHALMHRITLVEAFQLVYLLVAQVYLRRWTRENLDAIGLPRMGRGDPLASPGRGVWGAGAPSPRRARRSSSRA